MNCRPLKQLPRPIAMSRPMKPLRHYTAASRVSKFATEPAYFFKSLRISFSAACLLRLDCVGSHLGVRISNSELEKPSNARI